MNYIKQKDRILIQNTSEFNPEHILECGQIFRFKKLNDGYQVFSLDKTAKIIKNSNINGYEIITNDVDYFENFFDLKTDYSKIKKQILYLSHNEKFMRDAIRFGNGIRILNQDAFEATICFIISQNNNIKRIQLIVENICKKFGKNMGEYYAFPTPNQLLHATEQDFKDLGAGYRASYLVNAVKVFSNFDFENFKKQPIDVIEKKLLLVKGIGQKVADCIMLFGFHKMEYFPVDTWIEKVYFKYFCAEKFDNKTLKSQSNNRLIIRKNLMTIFQNYSGLAQQYLFYYQRSKK